MTEKLGRKEFITGYVTPSLEEGLPTVRVSKALAKEILKGDADSVEIRVTNDFAVAVLDAVETAYETAIITEQKNVGLGNLGQFKVVVKAEREFANPADRTQTVVKPEHLAVKFGVSKGFKTALEATTIN